MIPLTTHAEGAHVVETSGWLLEHDAEVPKLYGARMAGVAHYLKNSPGHATLVFSCRTDAPGVTMELSVEPTRFGFKTDDYEGPDATFSGPVTFANGGDPALGFEVAGWFGDGGPFDTGIPFIFGVNRGAALDAAVRRWLVPHAAGQMLNVTVPAADKGAPLTVQFRWPDDDAVFRRVVSMCLKK